MTENMSIYYDFHRSYEVSVWTLQDSFITVLKWSDIEHKETIQSPKMTINTDGTLNFSFSIPMSLYINGKWRDNPIWYNTTNGTLITNMRKIKVIFNKKTEYEEVFEFVITDIVMTHSKDTPMCDISCDGGLAFHELGKQGYKISLSSAEFENEDAEYFEDENGNIILTNEDIASNDNQLEATIDYWCKKMDLEYAATDADILDPRRWYYRVEMDWSSYSNIAGNERASNKIYEEEYVASWSENGQVSEIEPYKEKWRQIDSEGSNLYNLTQTVAQTFGVFCRYKYLYDDNYHIIGKLVIFYNNFFNEQEGVLQLTYPYQASSVSRKIDSQDIITKLYIDNIEGTTANGLLSITNTEANKMREDYILNFDYLHEVQTITDEQYEAVKQYEEDIRRFNNRIIPIQDKLTALYKEKIDVEAKKAVADNGRLLAGERLDDNEDLITALRNTDGVADNKTSYTVTAPDTVSVLKDGGTYFIKLNTKGILAGTLKIYPSFPINLNEELKVTITTDETGSITGAKNLSLSSTTRTVYCVYDYNPAVYYEQYRKTWSTKQAKDENDFQEYSLRLSIIEAEIQLYELELESTLVQKQECIKEFELMMGPALREGHWTPDNYNNHDKYVKTLKWPNYPLSLQWPLQTAKEDHLYAIWDKELFTEEQHNYFTLGVNETKTYYPHIYLTDAQWKLVLDKLKAEETVSLIYYDYAVSHANDEQTNDYYEEHELYKDSNWNIITLGSGAQIIFVLDGRTAIQKIRPAIIITDAENISDEEIAHIKATGQLAHVEQTLNENEDDVTTTINTLVTLTRNNWYEDQYLNVDSNQGCVYQVYPRLIIDTLDLSTDSDKLLVKYNNVALENYYDYQTLIRNTEYCITLKPETILLNGYSDEQTFIMDNVLRQQADIRYAISDASTAIYLDALQISKENAYPRVSYSVSPTILNKTLMRSMYSLLNRIVNINDNELKLHDAFGYISALDLDLDQPWEDSITVQNYNNKFEDIFSTITAQTEAMQRREYSLNEVMNITTTNGELNTEVFQSTLNNNSFNYNFNNQQLILNENEGLVGLSSSGAVTFRNNGIFTATEQDKTGNWIWKSAIIPSGINANLIKAGQLDTDKIMIYSGNDVRFQWNSEGLYAYRSILETPSEMDPNASNDVNSNQFVVFNSDGLSLIRKQWNFDKPIGAAASDGDIYWANLSEQNAIPVTGVKQVEVSWDGFKMRNYKNEEIFYANSTTGDLTITGNFSAHGGTIGGWHVDNSKLEASGSSNNDYVALNTGEYCIWAGDRDIANAPFYVKQNGRFKAALGEIGGWSININNISGDYIQLIAGANGGIMTTNAVDKELESVLYNNTEYYLYSYSYTNTSNAKVTGTAYHTLITFGVSASYKEQTVSAFNSDSYYNYKAVATGVEPKYTVTKIINTWNNSETEIESSTGIQYLAWTDEDDDTHNYEDMTAEQDPRIIRTNMNNANSGIIYDGDADDANELTASWYTSLQTIVNSSSRPTIVIDNTTLDLSSRNIASYVNYLYEDQLQHYTIDTNATTGKIRVEGNPYTPTCRIEAKTGKLVVNNATLGKFTLSPDKLANGLLSNTQLDTNTYVNVPISSGTKKITLDKLGQCFCSMSVNSKKGIVTFTKLNGDKVNFKTAALKASVAKNVAAGKITTHTLTVPASNNNQLITSYVKTGMGNTSTKTLSLDDVINGNAAYKHIALGFKIISNENKLCVYGSKSGTGNTYTTSQANPIAKITLTYKDAGRVTCTCICESASKGNMPDTTAILSDGGAYKAGWDTAYSKVSVYSSSLSSNATRTELVLKNPASVQNNQNTYRYIMNQESNNVMTIIQRLNEDTSTDLIVGRYIHNRYNAGWNAAIAKNTIPSQGSNNYITCAWPTSTIDGEAQSYQYILVQDISNKNKVNLQYTVNNTVHIAAELVHNQYNAGWNDYYNSLDINENQIEIDGIYYYPLESLPQPISE